MISSPDCSTAAKTEKVLPFWERLLNQEALRDYAPLAKLLVGCEVIAALDGVELLAA